MRISELAAQSGVSVATIKYYLREGLLPPGTKVGARRAEYGGVHLARLQLLRVLREVGDMPVSDLKNVVDAIDDGALSAHEMNGAAYDALARTSGVVSPEMRALAALIVQEAGWRHARPDSPAVDDLAALLGVIGDLGAMFDTSEAAKYLGLIDALAAYEVGRVYAAELDQDRDAIVQRMVIGQVVFGQLLLSLRRIAHEHHSALRYPSEPPTDTQAARFAAPEPDGP